MKRKDLTASQISSVPCPTCGAAVGEHCELHSGARRVEPHVDRKFAAIQAIEESERGWVNAAELVTLYCESF